MLDIGWEVPCKSSWSSDKVEGFDIEARSSHTLGRLLTLFSLSICMEHANNKLYGPSVYREFLIRLSLSWAKLLEILRMEDSLAGCFGIRTGIFALLAKVENHWMRPLSAINYLASMIQYVTYLPVLISRILKKGLGANVIRWFGFTIGFQNHNFDALDPPPDFW
jgi:hypothetical protein